MRRSSPVSRRNPWPLVAWALVACVALATGTAFATGFFADTSTAADANHGAATPVLGTPSAQDAPLYPGAITTTQLTIGFDGLWGAIAHDTAVFVVSVPSVDAGTGLAYPGNASFNLNVFSTNEPDLVNGAGGQTPWTRVSIAWVIAPCPGGVFSDETAASPTFATPTQQVVMAVTNGQLVASLTGMAAGTTYCVGVTRAAPDANDPAGTYLVRPYATDADANAANPAWTSATPISPVFTALIQRVA